MIIFGHPGIGKTYLRQTRKDVIDFDSDYKSKLNVMFNLKPGFKALNEWRESNDLAYKLNIILLWEEAKEYALKHNKYLLASDMILLRQYESDFDVIITMSTSTFIERCIERNDYTSNSHSWKKNLDDLISKCDSTKVLNTTKYISDLI